MSTEFYLVAGLGKTGLSLARYLRRRNLPFVLYDTRQKPAGLQDFIDEFPEVTCYLETVPSGLIGQLTAILTSPGLSLELPIFQEAYALGIPIYGDIECLAREINAPVIAITGTNGKSTVTTLVGEMAAEAGFRVAVAGNIGDPVLDKLDDGQSYDLWVLELSSFQLALTQSLVPAAATVLNITPDHLDRHHTLEEYIAIKHRIYNHAKAIVFNRQDEQTYPKKAQGALFSFGEDEPEDKQWGIKTLEDTTYLAQGQDLFLPVNTLRIKGVHNWQNALAACALVDLVGIKRENQLKVLRRYSGLPHRCQWVRQLDGVEWINDSKGTNIGATISAIDGLGASIQGKIVLIAGGQGKGADFKDLHASVKNHVRFMVVMGEDAEKIMDALKNAVPMVRTKTIEDAVTQARLQAHPGDVVLLSPACASLDMFKDFNHRGEVFTALVHKL